MITRWRLEEDPAWGAGIYTGAPRSPRVVVLRELPRARDTLLLRLMGRDLVLHDALEDLRGLPEDAWEHTFVPRLLLLLRDDLARMTGTDPADEELMMRYKEIEQWADAYLDRVRAEGEARGEARGEALGQSKALRESVLALCEVLAIPLDDRRRAQIAAADRATLQSMFETLRHARALPS
ncbi:MAG: hypothetical protein R3A48_00185 [Polyangiales bacterium]